MKVSVLGNTGMLGHVVESLFKSEHGVDVEGFSRPEYGDLRSMSLNELGGRLAALKIHESDYIINCVGAIKPAFDAAARGDVPYEDLLYVNSIFPHQLARWGQVTDSKVIHITTDCVYSGRLGSYVEDDIHDPFDMYGKSKSLGEPADRAMVIRTSIIGPEFGPRRRSFLEWLKSENGKSIRGFTNHYWNGLTTLELASCLFDVVSHDVWIEGLYHLFGTDVTKYEMVTEIIDSYGLNIHVDPFETDQAVDRTLRSIEELQGFCQPLGFRDMISQMREFEFQNV